MNISKNLLKNAAVLLMGAGAVCSATTSASATNARNWNGYTWARSGNLSIQLVNNTSAKWTPYLETAASQWSAAANIDYRVVTGPTVDASVCSPSYGVIEVCSANYGKTGWIGMTNVYTSGGHVVMATVRYNDYYASTSAWYASDAWYTNTSCHELGHALGLTHQDSVKNNANSGSCLDSTNDPSGTKSGYGPTTDLAPGSMDLAALADIYKTPSGTQLASTSFTMSSDGSFVPEPAAWAMMLVGFGMVGSTMRRRSQRTTMVTA